MANDLDVHQLGELPRDAVARLAEKEAGGDRERAMRVAVQQMQQAPNPSPSPDPRPRPIHYLAIQVGSALTRVTQQHADCSAPALAIRGGNPKRGGMLQIQMINVFRLLLYIATVVVVVWFVEEIVGRAILPRIKQVGAIVIVLLILSLPSKISRVISSTFTDYPMSRIDDLIRELQPECALPTCAAFTA